MSKLTRFFAPIGLALSLTVGCDFPKNYIEGKVTKEFGTLNSIVKEEPFTTNSAKLKNASYGLVLEASNQSYVMRINDYFTKPNFALAEAIKVGDYVRIKKGTKTYIGSDGIGACDSDDVSIVPKKEEKFSRFNSR